MIERSFFLTTMQIGNILYSSVVLPIASPASSGWLGFVGVMCSRFSFAEGLLFIRLVVLWLSILPQTSPYQRGEACSRGRW